MHNNFQFYLFFLSFVSGQDFLKPCPIRISSFFSKPYLAKHRYRLVNYDLYQSLGYAIGSGSVESTVKRIGARVKISGAQWLPQSVSKILHLRCAYLNEDFSLSISA
jgi:hypothetical protein